MDNKTLKNNRVYNLTYLDSNLLETDSLNKIVTIKKILNIKEKLWIRAENFRNRNKDVPMISDESIDFSYEEENEEEKPKTKHLGTSAFVSLSVMTIVTATASIAILVLGSIILN